MKIVIHLLIFTPKMDHVSLRHESSTIARFKNYSWYVLCGKLKGSYRLGYCHVILLFICKLFTGRSTIRTTLYCPPIALEFHMNFLSVDQKQARK